MSKDSARNKTAAAKTLAVRRKLAETGVLQPTAAGDDTRDDGDLWARLARGDWSSSAAAYETATVARRIITGTPMTVAAFAAECKRRNITGWQSQGSVSRRLRWAGLHDECWANGILPPNVFLSESATRPLFDGKLTKAERLKLLGELFGPHLTDEQKRQLAAELNEALMREHLAKTGQAGESYRAPRRLNWRKAIAQALEDGVTAEDIISFTTATSDSARNASMAG